MNDRPKKKLQWNAGTLLTARTELAAFSPEQFRQAVEHTVRKLWLQHRGRELTRPIAAALLEGPPAWCPKWLFYVFLAMAGAAQLMRELGPPALEMQRRKNPAAVALAKLGAAKGGQARARSLSPERRRQIASAAGKKGAEARWGKRKRKRK